MSPPHPPAPASLRHLPRDRDLAPRLCPLSSVLPASPCPLVTCWSPVVFGTADRVPLRWGSTGTACWLSPRLLARCPRRQPQPSRSLTPGPSAGRLPSVSALPNPLPPPGCQPSPSRSFPDRPRPRPPLPSRQQTLQPRGRPSRSTKQAGPSVCSPDSACRLPASLTTRLSLPSLCLQGAVPKPGGGPLLALKCVPGQGGSPS